MPAPHNRSSRVSQMKNRAGKHVPGTLKKRAEYLENIILCVPAFSTLRHPINNVFRARARNTFNIYAFQDTDKYLCLLFLLFFSFPVCAQKVSVRTNVLYWATATPNASFEWKLASRYTLSATVGYNAFNFPNRMNADGIAINPKLHHWLVMPEVKYWLCRAFERHYLGLHALYGEYNAGGMRLLSFLSDGRYDGRAVGMGVSYGYQWPLGRRWGVEASAGAGYIHFRYDKFECGACGRKAGAFRRHYFGPTKAALSIIYYIR